MVVELVPISDVENNGWTSPESTLSEVIGSNPPANFITSPVIVDGSETFRVKLTAINEDLRRDDADDVSQFCLIVRSRTKPDPEGYILTNATHSTTRGLSGDSPAPGGIIVNSARTKFYVTSTFPARIFEYTMSTPGNPNTATLTHTLNLTGSPTGLTFTSDEKELYYVETGGNTIEQYTMSDAGDLSTATATGSKDVTGDVTSAIGLAVKPDGTQIFILDDNDDSLHDFAFGTAKDITSITHTKSQSVSASRS
jgi:DNA-binding beta-propeller fold protein YncE